MTAGKPLIGVTTSRRRGLLMWWFNRFALWRAGARSVRLYAHHRIDLRHLDGLVLGGGDDIDAELYGMEIQPNIRIDRQRDALEISLLKYAREQQMPVLGICRGAQMINIALGGTLLDDIASAYQGRNVRTPLPRKTIRLMPGSRLRMIIGKSRDRVNALHHQAVAVLGRGLQVVARDEQGIVQAIECPTEPFLLGVQWHPEFLVWDSGQQRLYRALVAAVRRQDRTATPPASQATEERGLSADW